MIRMKCARSGCDCTASALYDGHCSAFCLRAAAYADCAEIAWDLAQHHGFYDTGYDVGKQIKERIEARRAKEDSNATGK